MDRLTPELEWLLNLSRSHLAWQEFAIAKAQYLAQKEPMDFGNLPKLLRQSVDSRKHGPRRPFTNQPRRSDGQGVRDGD